MNFKRLIRNDRRNALGTLSVSPGNSNTAVEKACWEVQTGYRAIQRFDRATPGRVLISAGELAGGGVKTHVVLLIKLLRRNGVGVTVIGTDRGWGAAELEELAATGARIRLPPKWLTALPNLRKLVRLYAVTSIPFWSWGVFSSVYLAGAGRSHLWLRRWIRRQIPVIYHEIICDPKPNQLPGLCALASDLIVANSRRIASQFPPLVGSSIPVKVIPFLTPGESLPTAQTASARGSNELRVVYLGRVTPHKRPDQLIKEWRQLTNGRPLGPARLDIYGYPDPPDFLNELKQLVKRSGLEQEISLHGPYGFDQVDLIIRSADVVVLPSKWEGLPLVLVESMRRGVPIVATGVGGIEEFGDGNPDVIITQSSWTDFVNGLQEMAARLRRGDINSVRLQRWAEDRYGYTTVSSKWLSALLDPFIFFHSDEKFGK